MTTITLICLILNTTTNLVKLLREYLTDSTKPR